jgi:two-component system secretion system response regulator SalR
MIAKEIIIAAKETGIHEWLLSYLREPAKGRYSCISIFNEESFNAYVSKPETVMAFIEVDFFRNKTLGMLEYLKEYRPKMRVVIFSVYAIPKEDVARYYSWGADGFLSLRDNEDDIKEQVKILLNGNRFITDVDLRYIDWYNGLPEKPPHLTHREIEIVCFLAKGLVKKEIGAALRISKKTVDNHIANIYGKFGVHNSVGILKLALSYGLITVFGDIVNKKV